MSLDLFDPAGRFADEVCATRVIDRDIERTSVVRRDDPTTRLTPPFRRPDATGEQPVYVPATIGDVTPPSFDHYPPIEPQPPQEPVPNPRPPAVPSWHTPASGWPTVPQRPKGRYVGRRRAALPLPAVLVSCYGAGLAGGMTILTVAWQVTR